MPARAVRLEAVRTAPAIASNARRDEVGGVVVQAVVVEVVTDEAVREFISPADGYTAVIAGMSPWADLLEQNQPVDEHLSIDAREGVLRGVGLEVALRMQPRCTGLRFDGPTDGRIPEAHSVVTATRPFAVRHHACLHGAVQILREDGGHDSSSNSSMSIA
jgi:hypothetical protein